MNRLADALSPYLLQHADNPVDWYPWGEEAFTEARRSDRPIFLSVGYAACHWCHVMAHESFENPEIASILNQHFVSVKVDREERPDIDQIYMTAVQLMTQHGGWPMSVFLDHDLQPFFAGTYWPPTPRFNMPSFPQVLLAVADAWQNRRDEIRAQAARITEALQQVTTSEQSEQEIPDAALASAACDHLLSVLDTTDGGFGGAPKFPHATDIDLLIRQGVAQNHDDWIQAAQFTLDKMAGGGIRDHIGGGFARYSVDAKWLVPHFEKMLYDNALLGEVYTRAFQATNHQRHADVAIEIFDYLCRDMVDPAGGFHCSEDADSEGEEGKYYVWTPNEVQQILGNELADRFCQIYDITESGNFEGKSIPHLAIDLETWANRLGLPLHELQTELRDCRERLRVAREQRVRPGRDDKVLASWNSLAVKALAVGGCVLDQPRFIDAAIGAAEFTRSRLIQPDGRMLHVFRRGESRHDAFLDDYAYTIEAWIALYEATGQAAWIDQATQLADRMIEQFFDRQHGGFYFTAHDAESLITRTKEWHDGSLISGNASAVMGLWKLGQLTERPNDREVIERTLAAGHDVLTQQTAACAALVTALDLYHHGHEQIVLAVPRRDDIPRLRNQFLRPLRPHATIGWAVESSGADSRSDPSSTDKSTLITLSQNRPCIDGKPTLYQCRDFVCDAPKIWPA